MTVEMNRLLMATTAAAPSKSKLVVAFLLLVGIIAMLGTLIVDQEQEACSFGTVTNEEYRQLKNAISKQIELPEFGTDLSVEAELSKAFDEFVSIHSDIYRKIAAAHAVLRIWGAQYRNTNGLSEDHDPFVLLDDPTRIFVTQIYYRSPTNPFMFLLQLGQGWRIFVRIAGPNAEKQREGTTSPVQRGTFRVTASLPTILLDGWKIPSADGSCPPVPHVQNVQNFSSNWKGRAD